MLRLITSTGIFEAPDQQTVDALLAAAMLA
jgi:hypothetical protein